MKYSFLFVFIVLLFSCQQKNTQSEGEEVDILSKTKTLENSNSPENNLQSRSIAPVFELSYIKGEFDPAMHPDFSTIAIEHADREGMILRSDAYADFVKMFGAAQKAGITLQIRSATRNFEYQKGIWENKWTGKIKIENGKDASVAYPNPVERAKQILLYSSMPGTSRHHWGTDIDLNRFENDWFRTGEGLKLYKWMLSHAHEYGFCQPYTDKTEYPRSGYEEERWHWSYMPISEPLTMQASRLLKNEMIKGFLGSEVAPTVNMVQNYVLGIHPHCFTSGPPYGE